MNRLVKKIIAYIIVLTLLMSAVFAVSANGEPGQETDTPSPEPTPLLSEIGSTGDIRVRASYEDNGIFDDNMSINTVDMSKNDEVDDIINAVRSIEREQDIFAVMKLSIQINGRDTALTKRINIRIEQTEKYAAYSDISVFFVNDAGIAQKMEASDDNGYISFTTGILGVFVLTGIDGHAAAAPSQEPESTHSLQTGENAGIITPQTQNTDQTDGNISETVSPGAFVFWLFIAVLIGVWLGIGIGYILWGRYKTKRVKTGPKVIGE